MREGMCKGPEAGTQTLHTSFKLAIVNSNRLREPRPVPGLPPSFINIYQEKEWPFTKRPQRTFISSHPLQRDAVITS